MNVLSYIGNPVPPYQKFENKVTVPKVITKYLKTQNRTLFPIPHIFKKDYR